MDTSRQEKKERDFSNVRRRTRGAMIEAAAQLVRDGTSPSVTEVADAAGVSRATAYRYFPTQESLLADVIVPDLEAALATEALPEDLESSFGAAFTTIWSSCLEHEAAYRTMLRRGLERLPGESVQREEEKEGAGSIRAGRRVRWLRNALAPARERMDEESFERLVAAMCLCVGIESLVVLRDVCGLAAEEAEEVARWAALALLKASLGEGERLHDSYSKRDQQMS
jgi:AcrR family transcriptional regulator